MQHGELDARAPDHLKPSCSYRAIAASLRSSTSSRTVSTSAPGGSLECGAQRARGNAAATYRGDRSHTAHERLLCAAADCREPDRLAEERDARQVRWTS
jgi:hypothetical protein